MAAEIAMETSQVSSRVGDGFQVSAVISAILGVCLPSAFLVKYCFERARGQTKGFIRWMSPRIQTAWAMSDKAVYVVRPSLNDETNLLEVVRVEFSEIQACVESDWEDTSYVRLYSKSRECFAIAEPCAADSPTTRKLVDQVRAAIV